MQLGGKNLIFPLNKQAIKILKRVGHWRTKTKSRFKRNENPQTRNWSLQIARHAERSINKNKANKNQSFRTLNKERTNLNRSFGSSNDRNFCSLEIKATNQICRNKHKLPGDRAATQMNKEVGAKRRRQTLLLLPLFRRGLSFFPPRSWKTSSQILFPIIFHQRILYALRITAYGINGDFRWGPVDFRMEGWVWP